MSAGIKALQAEGPMILELLELKVMKEALE